MESNRGGYVKSCRFDDKRESGAQMRRCCGTAAAAAAGSVACAAVVVQSGGGKNNNESADQRRLVQCVRVIECEWGTSGGLLYAGAMFVQSN